MRELRGVPIICVCGKFGSDLSYGCVKIFELLSLGPYATAQPDVMYSIKNYERKVIISNIVHFNIIL